VRAGTDDIYNVLPHREGEVDEAIRGVLQPGDVFVDVGANVGYYSIVASSLVGHEGAVVAVEPMPSTCRVLKMNCDLNHSTNVRLVPNAVSESEGMAPLYFCGYHGMASLEASKGTIIEVPTTTLDAICASYTHIKLVKIDAEGAEYRILSGASATMKKTDHIVVECGSDRDRILDLLGRSGFACSHCSFATYVWATAGVDE
jgi:FkbM family methyltransferase